MAGENKISGSRKKNTVSKAYLLFDWSSSLFVSLLYLHVIRYLISENYSLN